MGQLDFSRVSVAGGPVLLDEQVVLVDMPTKQAYLDGMVGMTVWLMKKHMDLGYSQDDCALWHFQKKVWMTTIPLWDAQHSITGFKV